MQKAYPDANVMVVGSQRECACIQKLSVDGGRDMNDVFDKAGNDCTLEE